MYLMLALLPLCATSPNCVSSEAEEPSHFVEPIHYTGSAQGAMKRLKQAVLMLPRTTLVEETPEKMHAECRSKWMGFVDDVICILDAEQSVIQISSASRIGYYDFGVNRARVEKIRLSFNALP